MNSLQAKTIQTVFIADDDSEDLDLFKGALSAINPGIQVEYLKNGTALMSILSHYVPDILFLDLDMPVKNGLQCLQEIRTDPKTATLPVVVYSSTSKPANISTAYDLGGHLFFIKPSIYGDLVRSIRDILELDWKDPEKIKKQYCENGRCKAYPEKLDSL